MKTKTKKSKYTVIYFTAFIQVLLVVINTWQIANGKYVGAVGVGFLISLVWTLNVKSVVVGGWSDRIVYSFGAATGTGFGLIIPHLVYGV